MEPELQSLQSGCASVLRTGQSWFKCGGYQTQSREGTRFTGCPPLVIQALKRGHRAGASPLTQRSLAAAGAADTAHLPTPFTGGSPGCEGDPFPAAVSSSHGPCSVFNLADVELDVGEQAPAVGAPGRMSPGWTMLGKRPQPCQAAGRGGLWRTDRPRDQFLKLS